MMDWNFDIKAAPRGKTVPVEQFRKGANGHVKLAVVETFAPDWIWAATRKGEVIKSHWLPPEPKHRPNGRWLNLSTDEQPVAWMRYVVPDHPGIPSEAPVSGEAA